MPSSVVGVGNFCQHLFCSRCRHVGMNVEAVVGFELVSCKLFAQKMRAQVKFSPDQNILN